MNNGFYTNFFSRGNNLYVRHYKDGIQCESIFPIRPKLYLNKPTKSKLNEVSTARTIRDEVIYPIDFDSPREAKDFIKTYKDTDMKIYGYPRFDYAEIDALFPNEIEFDYDLLRVITVDIETETESGFPNIFTANERISLISFSFRGHIYSFGLHAVESIDADVTYVDCKNNEERLLAAFYAALKKIKPDVITGWNSNGFDIPYIYNRTCVVINEDKAKQLSPYGWCKKTETNHQGRLGVSIEVDGIQTLDYLELYRKFELSPRENYKLDTIGLVEVNEQKHDFEGSFKDFYTNEFSKFARYNWQDVRLVDKINAKKQFISIAFNMAMSSKCNMGDVYRVTRIWDNIIANHLRERNVHVVSDFHHFGQSYEGAYVKPTIPGLYLWSVSFDVASLYPKNIEQYNISPDTILDSKYFPELTASDVIARNAKYRHAISVAETLNATLCANGSLYSREKQGFLPFLVEKYFNRRVTAKNQMKVWGKEAESVKAEIARRLTSTDKSDIITKQNKNLSVMSNAELESYLEECETKNGQFDSVQHSTKIMLNSMYGALGTPYFRMYDIFQAEGITLSGQCIVSQSYEVMNDFLNSTLKTNKDYVVASDTDSAYVDFTALMETLTVGVPPEKHVDILQKITDEHLSKKLTAKFDKFAIDTNAMSNKIDMKRESIASSCFVAKKNYVMKVYDNEGTRYASPKTKITGLEAIKSSTPKFFQEKLKVGYMYVFDNNESELQAFVKKVYEEYMSLPIADIAATTSVSELDKYVDGDHFVSGTPFQARASLTYNKQIIKRGLKDKYVPIRPGDKIKIINLKVPNPLHEKYFAYLDKFPYEVIDEKFIDRDLNYQKYFVGPLSRVLDVVKWKAEYVSSLDEFF